MTVICGMWPMSILTKPVGSKDRKLKVHPKDSVLRAGIRRKKDRSLYIKDPKAIKIKNGIYIPEDKEQGHRHIYCKDKNGIPHIYGRRLSVDKTYKDILITKELGKCSEFMQKMPEIPNESALDFELVWPGHPDTDVPTAIKSYPEQLHPFFFAPLIWEGNPIIEGDTLSWIEGRELLHSILPREYITVGYRPIEINDSNKVKVLTHLLNAAEKKGKEGFVLKEFSAAGWWKLKGIAEADVFVIGFKVSDAETRKGLITAINIGVYKGDEVLDMGTVAGFNLETMEKMAKAYNKFKTSTKNPYMYRVARVIYQEIAGKGKMKHGFFDGWRKDKTSYSCLIEQF